MAITLREGMNQDKLAMFICEIDFISSIFSRSSFKISEDETSHTCFQTLEFCTSTRNEFNSIENSMFSSTPTATGSDRFAFKKSNLMQKLLRLISIRFNEFHVKLPCCCRIKR
jgi:hypothetical protein